MKPTRPTALPIAMPVAREVSDAWYKKVQTSNPVTMTGSTPNYGTTTVPYGAGTLGATGGGGTYVWSIASGALPAGLTLNTATGAITGTPTAAGTASFTLKVADAADGTNFATSALSIVVAAFPVLSGALTFATISTAYSQGLTATGGHAPLAWDISVGTLPAGLSIDSTTGVISGTPTTYGDNAFTVRVTDAHGNVATSAQSVTVYGTEQAPTMDNAWALSLNAGAAGTVTQDGTGITFAGAQNLANGNHATVGNMVDNAVYDVKWTLAGRTGGSFKILLYGASNAHSGGGASKSADGTFTERLTLNGAGTAYLNKIVFQATGTNGTNSGKCTLLSIKRVG